MGWWIRVEWKMKNDKETDENSVREKSASAREKSEKETKIN